MKEIKYIVHATLLVLLVVISFTFFTKLSFVSSGMQQQIASTDNFEQPVVSSRGKELFRNKCASCHIMGKDFTGPNLQGFIDRGPWADRKKLYQWMRNPSGFMKTDTYTQELKDRFPTMMQAFPEITDEEIDQIVDYINSASIMAVVSR